MLEPDDDVDGSKPVYNPTTELVESTNSLGQRNSIKDCICCLKTKNCWSKFKNRIPEFSNRQWTTLVMLCLGTLTSSLSVCLFPPFFPKLVRKDGFFINMIYLTPCRQKKKVNRPQFMV